MRWTPQERFCPNCGKRHYDDRLTMSHVKSMCCDADCRVEWEKKYACMLLGKEYVKVDSNGG